MNSRKSQNSVLFLATLGVYLGLVLTGATPVLGHAATSRQFDIRDEIEFADEFDNKPDDSDLYVSNIEKLVRDLDRLSSQSRFDWYASTQLSIEDLGFEDDNSPSFLGFGELPRDLQKVIENADIDTGRRLFTKKSKLGAGDFYSGWPETINFEFRSDPKSLQLEFKVNTASLDGARSLGNFIASYLSQKASSKLAGQRIIAENTKSKVEDTHVFLITHLPRAAIDSLLSKDAK